MAEGYNPKRVYEVLRQYAMINPPDAKGKAAISGRLPELGQQRYYIITPQEVDDD